MRTISVIVEPDEDGTLRLPLPEEWRSRKVRVLAVVESVEDDDEEVNVTSSSSNNRTDSIWQKSFEELTDRRGNASETVLIKPDPIVDMLRRAKIVL